MKSTSYSGQLVILLRVQVIVQQKYFAGIYFVDWRFCFLFYPVSFSLFFFNKNDKKSPFYEICKF